MAKIKQTLILSIIFLFIFSIFPGGAVAENTQVAKVTAVDGNLNVKHENSDEWLAGTAEMPLYLNDTLQTQAGSFVNIEFSSGGLVSINENTTIQITGVQEVTDVTEYSFIQKVVITSGEIWAKITKQQEEIQFETNGGTVSIKGTEFVIETDGEETNVSLLEGKISFLDNLNNEITLLPGDKLSAIMDQIPVIQNLPVDELRVDLEGQFPNLNNIMYQVLNNIPNDPNDPNFPTNPNNPDIPDNPEKPDIPTNNYPF